MHTRAIAKSTLAAALICATVSACNWVARVNTNADGEIGAGAGVHELGIGGLALSANGRYAVFHSHESNLVPEDYAFANDIFRKDNRTGEIIRVTVASDGTEADRTSDNASISGDGRYVLFTSSAQNLVPNDTNGRDDVFLHDTFTGITTRESVASDGSEGSRSSSNVPVMSLSNDARWVTFSSAATEFKTGYDFSPSPQALRDQVYLRDRSDGSITGIPLTGATVVFSDSPAPGGGVEVDRYINMTSSGTSSDGRYTLVNVSATVLYYIAFYPMEWPVTISKEYLYDHQVGTLTPIADLLTQTLPENAGLSVRALSPLGRFIALRVSVSGGWTGNPGGKSLGLHLLDTQTGLLAPLNVPPTNVIGGHADWSWTTLSSVIVSEGGRYVVFNAQDTTGGGFSRRGYIRDMHNDITYDAVVASNGEPPTGSQGAMALSADGRYLGFCGGGANLVPDPYDDGRPACYISSLPVMAIDSAVPQHIPSGATTSITVTGQNFLPGVLPIVAHSQISNFVRVDDSTATMDVTVPADIPAGNLALFMVLFGTGPGGGAGSGSSCADCITAF